MPTDDTPPDTLGASGPLDLTNIDALIRYVDALADHALAEAESTPGAVVSYNHWLGRHAAYRYLGAQLWRAAGRDPFERVLGGGDV